jgi:hypothetical protein
MIATYRKDIKKTLNRTGNNGQLTEVKWPAERVIETGLVAFSRGSKQSPTEAFDNYTSKQQNLTDLTE